jgi:hypothetical protein
MSAAELSVTLTAICAVNVTFNFRATGLAHPSPSMIRTTRSRATGETS